MKDTYPVDETSRRAALKTLGSLGVAGTVLGPLSAGSETVSATPTTIWKDYTWTEQPDPNDTLTFGSSTLISFGAQWDRSRQAYVHDLVLSSHFRGFNMGLDPGEPSYGTSTMNHQWYDIRKYASDAEQWVVEPSINPGYSGAYPKGSGDTVPDWVELPVDIVAGLYSNGAGVALAIDDVLDALDPSDGLRQTSPTRWEFDLGHHALEIWEGSWQKAGHYQRFELEVPPDIDDLEEKHLGINVGASTTHAFSDDCVLWLDLQFDEGTSPPEVVESVDPIH